MRGQEQTHVEKEKIIANFADLNIIQYDRYKGVGQGKKANRIVRLVPMLLLHLYNKGSRKKKRTTELMRKASDIC